MASADLKDFSLKNKINNFLHEKANGFLNNRAEVNNLLDIILHFEKCFKESQPLIPVLLTFEIVFHELIKRRAFLSYKDLGYNTTKSIETETKHIWLKERYEQSWQLMIKAIACDKPQDSSQALVSCMRLMAEEGKYPLDTNEALRFPRHRLSGVLEKLVSTQQMQIEVLERFKKYVEHPDVVQNCWKILSNFTKKSAFTNEIAALNFLQLLRSLSIADEMTEHKQLLCSLSEKAPDTELYNYASTRKYINKVWNNLMTWLDIETPEKVHKQMLILLLERILPHLESPILLTDFLMDSLECGGATSLLALQGVFTLIQKHNITYPDIYEKLYSMFEPEIFHTKFKARLFYLADVFLSSTHLPENLVAAFVKRLARLSLIAPPQDAIVILYFIRNLILRHKGLVHLICAQQPQEVTGDPFVMEERNPTKSNAINSSLWEAVLLQKHCIPSVATAANFISHPLPEEEWDLSSVLEIKEDDIFDEECIKQPKTYALTVDRSQTLFSPKNDVLKKHWRLF